MINNNTSKTLELILSNLSSTISDTKITIFLNSPNITEVVSIDTTFSLTATGIGELEGITEATSILLDVNCDANIPIDIKSIGVINIPSLSIEGSTYENSVPINLSLDGYHSFDISGTAKGTVPKLHVEANIPMQELSLPLVGEATGSITLNTLSQLEIPQLILNGKTRATEVNVDVVGTTSQDLKLHSIVTGTIPQLKVIGSTHKTPLELDLEGNTSADISSASVDALQKIALDRADFRNMPILRPPINPKRGIKLRLVGKAKGYINPIPVDGLTTAEEISLPMIEESNYSLSLISTGKLTIPELDVTLTSPSQESMVITELNDTINLPIIGKASGKIPPTKIKGTTYEDTVISDVVGKSTGTITIDAQDHIKLPKLEVKGNTSTVTIPVELTGNTTINESIIGTASGTIPQTTVNGTTIIKNIPVSGSITAKPNCISKHPSFNGYISSVESGLLNLREDSTNNLLTIDIDAISFITFETESSIISPNKFSIIPSSSSIEKALINKWYKEGSLKLYGSNTTNPLNTIVNTNDIKYINKGVMWVEEYVIGGICNTVYNIDKIIGFSIIN